VLGRHPAATLPILHARRRPGQFLAPVADETEIVIEGFPRSGNTFAVAAFHLAQEPRDVKIAHHAHVPAQLLAAVRAGLPALALIRRPEDCVLSLSVRVPDLAPGAALRGWVRFYEPLAPVRDALVVAAFVEVVADLAPVIRRVNERFGTRFREFEHTPENVARVMALIERGDLNTFGSADAADRAGGRPSEARARLKDELRGAYHDRRLASLRGRADRLYEALAGSSRRAT
jgi:hypothetical protein